MSVFAQLRVVEFKRGRASGEQAENQRERQPAAKIDWDSAPAASCRERATAMIIPATSDPPIITARSTAACPADSVLAAATPASTGKTMCIPFLVTRRMAAWCHPTLRRANRSRAVRRRGSTGTRDPPRRSQRQPLADCSPPGGAHSHIVHNGRRARALGRVRRSTNATARPAGAERAPSAVA